MKTYKNILIFFPFPAASKTDILTSMRGLNAAGKTITSQ